MREYHLISAPFSCGISWAVSVLMELGIRVTHAEPRRYPKGFWTPTPGKPGVDSMVPEGVAHMRYYLPLLHQGNEFRFDEALEIFWEHRLDFARRVDRPVILFTRDPRDAIHSLYQRNYRHFSWMEYLHRPDLWQDHFPGMFGLPPAETWAAWHAFWMGLESLTPIHVVRFEETKIRPVEVVKQMLVWLDVERSDIDIRRAVDRSSFSKIHEAMTRTEAATGQKFGVARRGKVGEWKETMDAQALQALGGPAAHWMQEFGYEPAEASLQAGDLRHLALKEELTTATQQRLHEFRRLWSAGNVSAAREKLEACRATTLTPQATLSERLTTACYHTAFSWTEKVLGSDLLSKPVARAVFTALHDFTRNFAEWPSLRQMLLESIQGSASVRSDVFGSLDVATRATPFTIPAPSAPPRSVSMPVLVEEDYKGYRLVGFGGRFYAISRDAIDLDLRELSAEELHNRRAQGKVFSGDLGFEVKAAIDRFVRAA